MGCLASKDKAEKHPIATSWDTLQRPLIFGHRGGSLKLPENTLEAMIDSIENGGADGVEVDVFVTKDSKVVVFHDETTERVCTEKVKISDCTWDQLSKINIKRSISYDMATLTFDKDYHMPLLEDVLKAMKGRLTKAGVPVLLNIELKPTKPGSDAHVAPLVVNLVKETGMVNQVIITGFDFMKLKKVHHAFPEAYTGWGYDDDMSSHLGNANVWYEDEPTLGDHKKFEANSKSFLQWIEETAVIDKLIGSKLIDLEWTCIDNDTIEKFHKKGYAVGSYTMYPYDQSSVKRKVSDKTELYKETRNVITQLVKRRINWLECDDVVEARKVVLELTNTQK